MSEGSSSTRVVSTERFEALRREYRLRVETNRARTANSAQRSTGAAGSTHSNSGTSNS